MLSQTYSLLDTLMGIKLVGHQQHGSLEVFHVRWSVTDGPAYTTLDEALEAKWIEVAEYSEAGQVPRIKVINHSEQMVFLMAGEQLVGCKQNRVVNASMMVPAHSEMPLPVTCVESGRWGYTSTAFSSAHSSSHHALRAMMAGQTTQAYRFTGTPTSDQRAVWGEVSRKLESMGSISPSQALHDMFRDYGAKLKESLEHLPAPAWCNGAVFVIEGSIVGADLFDKSETLRRLWPKLIRSCVIDALERPEQTLGSTPPEGISRWLENAATAREEPFPSPGMGVDVRIEGTDVVGASLVVDDQPIHMELFHRSQPKAARPKTTTRSQPPPPINTGGANRGRSSRTRSWLGRALGRISKFIN